jgi:hypothetical protein
MHGDGLQVHNREFGSDQIRPLHDSNPATEWNSGQYLPGGEPWTCWLATQTAAPKRSCWRTASRSISSAILYSMGLPACSRASPTWAAGKKNSRLGADHRAERDRRLTSPKAAASVRPPVLLLADDPRITPQKFSKRASISASAQRLHRATLLAAQPTMRGVTDLPLAVCQYIDLNFKPIRSSCRHTVMQW